MARPRKPNHIKKSAGTFRADRSIENYPRYDMIAKLPSVSKDLNSDGKAWFNHFVQIMIDQGLMTTAYISDFENHAFIYQSLKEFERDLSVNGYWMQGQSGWRQANPAWKSLMEATKSLKEFSNRYGLDLASSQKISMPTNDHDELDD